MKSRITSLAVVLLLLVCVAPVQAQGTYIYVGAGILSPVGDAGDALDTGWMATGGVGVPVGSGSISVGAEGLYGSVSGVSDGPSVDLLGLLGTVSLTFGDPGGIQPYVIGGAGIIRASTDSDSPGLDGSDTNFGYEAIGGLAIPAGDSFSLWVEGGYLGTSDFDAIRATGGVAIVIG